QRSRPPPPAALLRAAALRGRALACCLGRAPFLDGGPAPPPEGLSQAREHRGTPCHWVCRSRGPGHRVSVLHIPTRACCSLRLALPVPDRLSEKQRRVRRVDRAGIVSKRTDQADRGNRE